MDLYAFSGPLDTEADVRTFVSKLGVAVGGFHGGGGLADRKNKFWFNLVQSRVSNTRFEMKSPHLLRIMSKHYNRRNLSRGTRGYRFNGDIEQLGFPSGLCEETCVGLCSSTVCMVLSEPWPDIPLMLQDLKRPPNCAVDLRFTDMRFVCLADDASAVQQNSTSGNWFLDWLKCI
jgi:hypothetical protein